MRVAIVPGTLALLSEYSSAEDPIADLRKAALDAVAWLGPARVLGDRRVGAELLGEDLGDGPGLLVIGNGSAMRTEKAPGHFDERAEEFDAALGRALRAADRDGIAGLDRSLAVELWADVEALTRLGDLGEVFDVQVDYDDAPYGVQYWVVRWQCR